MSEQTTKEMTDDWTLKMAARNHRGERLTEVDPAYRREVHKLAVQIAERHKAEEARPQINEQQLAWLSRAQGAMSPEKRNADGVVTEPSRRMTDNPVYAKNLREAREKVFAGGDISGLTLGEGVTLGPEFKQPTADQRLAVSEAKTGGFGPPSHYVALPKPDSQANTKFGGV